jgi:nucleoredoxin
MERLLGSELLDKNNKQINTKETLEDKKIIGLYFSGSYCPPCIKFTPILSKVYNELKELDKSIEIIFISSDKTIESFQHYYNYMPWLALPYEKRNMKTILCNLFEVQTIPHLVFLDNQGNILDSKGRYFIQNNKDNINEIINTFNL